MIRRAVVTGIDCVLVLGIPVVAALVLLSDVRDTLAKGRPLPERLRAGYARRVRRS